MSSTNDEMPSSSKYSKEDSSSDESIEQDIYINPADGLPTELPTVAEKQNDDDSETEIDPFDKIPSSVIVTNIHLDVFNDPEEKSRMEELFSCFGDNVVFQWLRSFRRLRVTYDNPVSATAARVGLNEYEFNEKTTISVYFAQTKPLLSRPITLQLPALTKQYIISPPASPPAGWEPRLESQPLVNRDLIAALASLCPGDSYEVCESSEEYPGIVVHTVDMSDSDDERPDSPICPYRTQVKN